MLRLELSHVAIVPCVRLEDIASDNERLCGIKKVDAVD